MRAGRTLVLVICLAMTALTGADGHGEGGATVREGAFDITPVGAGGSGYAEAQFPLLKGDGLLHQWRVNSPSGARVEFNLHGHVGAEVQVFNRSAGGSGGGSMIASAEMKVALMWRSNSTGTVNVSWSVQLQHAPDLYSSAFFTANLAGLVLLFAAVWELSIRGRRKIEEASGEESNKEKASESKSAGSESKDERPSPKESKRPSFFSDWRRRAAVYALALLLASLPILSFQLRGEGPSGAEPRPSPWAAFIASSDGTTLQVVDPIRAEPLGSVRLGGKALQLVANPSMNLVYAYTRPGADNTTLEIIDGTTFAVLRSVGLASVSHGYLSVSPDGKRLYSVGEQWVEVLDARDGTSVGRMEVPRGWVLGFLSDPARVVVYDTGNRSILTYDEAAFTLQNSLRLGNDSKMGALSPSGKLFIEHRTDPVSGNMTLHLRETESGAERWAVPSQHVFWKWFPDESVILGGKVILVAVSVSDGKTLAEVPVPLRVGDTQVSARSNLVYVAPQESANLTVINSLTWKIVASFEAGLAPGNPLLLDATGSYAISLAAGSDELVTFHDQPDLHYHSRIKVGDRPTLCVLLEPPR